MFTSYHILPIWFSESCTEHISQLCTWFQQKSENTILRWVTKNNFDHKSYDTRQCILTYLTLLKLCSDELADCKFQITQLTSQVNNIFATLDQNNPKCTKRGIIHSLFSFVFGDSNSAEEIKAIKNNMPILEENQDILSSQKQKTFNFVNLTYSETDTNLLLLRSLQKDIPQINITAHNLSKELKALFMTEISLSLCPSWEVV